MIFAVLTVLMIGFSSFALADGPLTPKKGALMCPSYSAIDEAYAAISARDNAWFDRTGCFSVGPYAKIYVIRKIGDRAEGQIYTSSGMNLRVFFYTAQTTMPQPPVNLLSAIRSRNQLTASDIDLVRAQLISCFNPSFGAKEKPDLVADIKVVMNRDGTVQQARVADQGQYDGDPIYRAIADSGIRALKNPRCSPLRLPPDRYDLWQSFIFGFNIRDMQ